MKYFRTWLLSVILHVWVVQAFPSPLPSVLPPKTEVRAVWVTTAAALDWPHVSGKAAQRESLRRLVHDLYKAHFNTIYFQVRPRGDALYRSRYEPWAEALSGTLGKDPGWDPCAFILEEAHALGMEVHGWFNVFKVRGPNAVVHTTPEHPSLKFAQWCAQRDGELWLDPGRPEIRSYLVNVALDLIRNYDLDGINFDFIRYPGHNFPDSATYRQYGNGIGRDDWRRNNITAFVRQFAEQAGRIKPSLKIGSSPFGVWRSDANNDRRGSYYWVYQDSYSWLQHKWHDYLSPQVYWYIGKRTGEPDFAEVVRGWGELTAGRHIYVGIGAYRSGIRSQLGSYIDTCRSAGSAGHTFFRWADIASPSSVADRYQTIALIPPMRWKDAAPPLEPQNLKIATTGPRRWTVSWDAPLKARDGDTAFRYVVYRWSSRFIPYSNPLAIAAVLPATRCSFADSLQDGKDDEYYYAISACDRAQNESTPSSVIPSKPARAEAPTPPDSPSPSQDTAFTAARHTANQMQPVPTVSLSIAVANSTGRPLAALYSVQKRTRVALDVFLKRDGATDSLQAQLVRAVQGEGKYKVSLDGDKFAPGTYLMRLMTPEATVEQAVVVGE
jgi:uncharacterized lipoprotein YddW (UPF0748 family)